MQCIGFEVQSFLFLSFPFPRGLYGSIGKMLQTVQPQQQVPKAPFQMSSVLVGIYLGKFLEAFGWCVPLDKIHSLWRKMFWVLTGFSVLAVRVYKWHVLEVQQLKGRIFCFQIGSCFVAFSCVSELGFLLLPVIQR